VRCCSWMRTARILNEEFSWSGSPCGCGWRGRTAAAGTGRILSTVLFGLATLELIRARPHHTDGYLAHFAVGGHVYSVIHSVFGATVLGVIVPMLT